MPSVFLFEPRSPRYGLFLVLRLLYTNCAQFGPLLAAFGPFLGYIVEVEDTKEGPRNKAEL